MRFKIIDTYKHDIGWVESEGEDVVSTLNDNYTGWVYITDDTHESDVGLIYVDKYIYNGGKSIIFHIVRITREMTDIKSIGTYNYNILDKECDINLPLLPNDIIYKLQEKENTYNRNYTQEDPYGEEDWELDESKGIKSFDSFIKKLNS